MRIRSWIAGMVLAGLVGSAASGAEGEKKLVNFGWDMISPSQMAERIGDLQHLPFDGFTVRQTNYCYTFYSKSVHEEGVRGEEEAMSRIKWGKFTDNFMYMVTGDNVDWFDDAAWADDGFILKNVRAIARIGKAGGCKGILFDPEFVYWGQPNGDPWKYRTQASRNKKTVAEYRAMVRKRGVQFIDAIEETEKTGNANQTHYLQEKQRLQMEEARIAQEAAAKEAREKAEALRKTADEAIEVAVDDTEAYDEESKELALEDAEVAEAHAEGGYEVETAPFFYRYPARLAAECAQIAIEAATRSLRGLW